MESKESLDEFIDELNEGALPGNFITYTWWPEDQLKLQYGGKAFMRIIADSEEESYASAEESLKSLIRDKISDYSSNTRLIWN